MTAKRKRRRAKRRVRKVARDARTGKFVTARAARRRPATTTVETMR